ncbi:hypothetical protein LOK46_24200 [Methylobacterium sp. NMS14P]|uniref:hypothetical protein n=1 Tax=unclassified Methylobacterium TaxID=2615210 RepID=UPI002359F2DC|nr:hypothetical protein [Methylobacterium sp. NMS14P]WCS24211.1 hypothetical protein LOK46_24200 [Methylobacterium sp. NMS14P]
MERETSAIRIVQLIAAELGVPVACFYDQAGSSPSDNEAMQKAVAALLSAFGAVRNPEEHRRSVAVLSAEAERLRDLLDDKDRK